VRKKSKTAATLRDAAIATAVPALYFGLFGSPYKFPGEWVGFVGFLILVFVLAILLHGRVD
jgi:hypothetical protein